jgi:hypothetical protein
VSSFKFWFKISNQKCPGKQLGTHQIVVSNYGINIMGKNMTNIRRNTETPLIAIREICPELNTEKSSELFKLCQKNIGLCHRSKQQKVKNFNIWKRQ